MQHAACVVRPLARTALLGLHAVREFMDDAEDTLRGASPHPEEGAEEPMVPAVPEGARLTSDR